MQTQTFQVQFSMYKFSQILDEPSSYKNAYNKNMLFSTQAC